MSMQKIIMGQITDKVSIPLHMLRVNEQYANTGSMGLVKFGEILPKKWIRFDFQHDHVTFYSANNQRLASIYYYDDDNSYAVSVIDFIVEMLQDS